MVERLMEAKDDQYDLTNMENEIPFFDDGVENFLPENNETFWDNLGILLS